MERAGAGRGQRAVREVGAVGWKPAEGLPRTGVGCLSAGGNRGARGASRGSRRGAGGWLDVFRLGGWTVGLGTEVTNTCENEACVLERCLNLHVAQVKLYIIITASSAMLALKIRVT